MCCSSTKSSTVLMASDSVLRPVPELSTLSRTLSPTASDHVTPQWHRGSVAGTHDPSYRPATSSTGSQLSDFVVSGPNSAGRGQSAVSLRSDESGWTGAADDGATQATYYYEDRDDSLASARSYGSDASRATSASSMASSASAYNAYREGRVARRPQRARRKWRDGRAKHPARPPRTPALSRSQSAYARSHRRSQPGSSAGSVASTSSSMSSVGMRRRQQRANDAKVPRKWKKGQLAEQNDLVAQLGWYTANGQPVPKLLWARFESLSKRAKVADPYSPGPGHYLKLSSATSLGKQVLSGRRSHSGASFKPIIPVADVTITPKGRLKNKAKYLDPQPRPPTKAEALAMAAPPSSVLPQRIDSRYRSCNGFSQSGRTVDPRTRVSTQTPGPSLNPSGFNTQILSHLPTGPTTVFTTAKPLGKGAEDEQRNAPSAVSYHPNYAAVRASAPAAALKSRPSDEFNPFTSNDAGPASYFIPGGVGAAEVSSMLPSKPRIKFAMEPQREMTVALATFEQAHERRQPLGVRKVHTPLIPPRFRDSA